MPCAADATCYSAALEAGGKELGGKS
jgi:hypothetical protein